MQEKYWRGILDTCLKIEKISRKALFPLGIRVLSVRNCSSIVKVSRKERKTSVFDIEFPTISVSCGYFS